MSGADGCRPARPGAPVRRPASRRLSRRLAALALVAAAAPLAACTAEPGAPLFSPRPAPVAPGPVATHDADGYPNVLLTPGNAPGRYRPVEEVVAAEGSLAARGARVEGAAGRALATPSIAPALRARAATHEAETRRAIEAGGRASAPLASQ